VRAAKGGGVGLNKTVVGFLRKSFFFVHKNIETKNCLAVGSMLCEH
jgi:hypothetical protein